MANGWQLTGDLIGQTIKVFVPAVGMVEGVVQAVGSGDPKGIAKILIPGIGMIEGAVGAGSDVWQATGGVAGAAIDNTVQAAMKFAIIGGVVLLAIVLLKD